jgi:hypothetical protein
MTPFEYEQLGVLQSDTMKRKMSSDTEFPMPLGANRAERRAMAKRMRRRKR